MLRLKIRSLHQRIVLFVLIPVAVILLCTGFLGFLLARDTMINQWRETASIYLQRTGHFIETRLSKPVEWIQMFHRAGQDRRGHQTQRWIIEQLKTLEGVAGVQILWKSTMDHQLPRPDSHRAKSQQSTPSFYRGRIVGLSEPVFNAQQGTDTVSIYSQLSDQNGHTLGELKVELRFDYLLEELIKEGWWRRRQVFLVDRSGHFILQRGAFDKDRRALGEHKDPFELRVLEHLQNHAHGTVFDDGRPPKNIAGYYNVTLSGWALVLIAPGSEILAPIVQFRNYFFAGGVIFVLVILLLMRFSLARVVQPVKAITRAAQRVAKGDYSATITPRTSDEVGQLAHSFNLMIAGLRERDFIRNTFGRYMDHEVARKLLQQPETIRLGGDKRQVAILMADLRNFTPLADTLTPEETIQLVNRFFGRMIEVVNHHHGIIVDFYGDSLLVFFDPLNGDLINTVAKAVACALSMQDAMGELRQKLADARFADLQMGIGVNLGEVVVGNIGSETRTKYGIVGSAVNATQRMQSVAQGKQVVVSQSIQALIGDRLTVGRAFEKTLKGFQAPVALYVVTACRCEIQE